MFRSLRGTFKILPYRHSEVFRVPLVYRLVEQAKERTSWNHGCVNEVPACSIGFLNNLS